MMSLLLGINDSVSRYWAAQLLFEILHRASHGGRRAFWKRGMKTPEIHSWFLLVP